MCAGRCACIWAWALRSPGWSGCLESQGLRTHLAGPVPKPKRCWRVQWPRGPRGPPSPLAASAVAFPTSVLGIKGEPVFKRGPPGGTEGRIQLSAPTLDLPRLTGVPGGFGMLHLFKSFFRQLPSLVAPSHTSPGRASRTRLRPALVLPSFEFRCSRGPSPGSCFQGFAGLVSGKVHLLPANGGSYLLIALDRDV